MMNSRQAAFETLYKIFYDSAYSNLALDYVLSDMESGKAFASRLVYGVLERKLTLDYLIEKYCKKPKPKVLIILRMGVYQLYFMDKVPANAAVNESVELARKNGLSYYTKLINAVLHKISENKVNINEMDDISIRYSVPQHLINMWYKAYGKDTVHRFLPAVNCSAPVFAVPNSKFVDADELLYELNCDGIDGEVINGVVMLTSATDLTSASAFKNGLFHIQDLSCFEAIKALGISENDRILDVCASPGGKSFTAAYLADDKCFINAYDIHKHRVKLISDGAERLCLRSIHAEVNDAAVFNPDISPADKIICDVPCSGFGIIRRKPEIRYKNLDDIKELPEIQYSILKTSAGYLKKGGRLLYSTCTLNKRENENVVSRFISENSEFSVSEMKTVFPSEFGGDGFFYSVIERK